LKHILRVLLACLFPGVVAASEPAAPPRIPPPFGPAHDIALLEGLAAIHQGRFSEGQARFRAFSDADPTDPRGPLFLAFSLWWRLLQFRGATDSEEMDSRLQEAIHLAEVKLSQSPGDPEALASLGTAYIFLAQYRASQRKVFRAASAARKGRNFLEKALAQDPGLVDPHFGLGAYNYYADKVNLLVKGLRTMLFLPGGNSDLGLTQLRHVAEGGRYFRTEAHLLLAVIYQGRREQRHLEALDHLRSALALNPGSPVILASIGDLQMHLGRYPEAHATLRRCVKIASHSEDPDQLELARLARILLADSLDLSLHSSEALKELNAALTRDGLQPELRRRALAVATRAAGRCGETQRLDQFYRTLTVTPEEEAALQRRYGTDPQEANLFRVLSPALRMLEEGKIEEARGILRKLESRYPTSFQIRFHLARSFFEQGRWAEAETRFRQIQDPTAEAIPTWVRGWRDLYLGRAIAMQGRPWEGRELYRSAAELDRFRGQDLARALLGPEGNDPRLWPRRIFALGLENAQDSADIGPGLPVGGNAPVPIHRLLPGIVSGEGEPDLAIAPQELLEIAGSAFQILDRIKNIRDLKTPRRLGHQLHEPHRSPV